MTAQTVDPFDLDEPKPPRDRYSRPLLVPKGGGERVPFTRMSTLSGYIADDFGLSIWTQRLLAIGYARRPDLAAMVAALPALNDAERDKKSLTAQQRKQDAETKKKIDEYNEQALEAAGRNWKANSGTAVHGFIEHGHDLALVPERMRADVQSCFDTFAREGIEVVASEQFVVNDELGAAGSFDHLVRTRYDGIVVLDVKTGSIENKSLAFAVQLAGYANSVVYDCDTEERRPLESLTGGERVNRDVGLICHVPLGGGRCELHRVNLRVGLHAARLAKNVRTAREIKNLMSPYVNEDET